MSALTNFFLWFLFGDPAGLGGWVFFLLLGVVSVVWILYDSSKRRLPALGWRMAAILTALLIVPVIAYRFTIDPADPGNPRASPLAPLAEPIFYLGLLGGIAPAAILIGYFITFRGLVGCPRGLHAPYEAVLGQCPECARLDNPPLPTMVAVAAPVRVIAASNDFDVSSAPPPQKRTVQAWLLGSDGQSYQLCEKETTIGRLSTNDIHLTGDKTVSRQHAKITEKNGQFRLIDLGSRSLTRVNGQVVREPVLLETDDEIKLGDNTVLRFMGTAQH
jgi:hypothetical protein